MSKCGRLGRCIVQRLCATAIVHPCTTRTVRVRPPAPKKAGLCLFVITKCGGAGLSKCACSVGFASCETWGKHYRASLRLRSFGSLRPCSDFVRPLSCILARPTKCGFSHPPTHKKCNPTVEWAKVWRGGVSKRACSVGFASCLVSRLGCHIVWQLSAADFKHPCLKLGASTIVHPCTTRTVRVRPPSTKKAGICLFRHIPAFLVPMAGVEPARYCYQRILSPSRLPIPSHRLIIMCCKTALHNGNNDFTV